MGIFTTALRNKKIRQILKKKYLTLLPQRIACYLTAYFDEKNPFWRVVHFGVFYVHKKSPYVHKKRETRRVTILVIIFRTATFVGDIQRFNELAS